MASTPGLGAITVAGTVSALTGLLVDILFLVVGLIGYYVLRRTCASPLLGLSLALYGSLGLAGRLVFHVSLQVSPGSSPATVVAVMWLATGLRALGALLFLLAFIYGLTATGRECGSGRKEEGLFPSREE